MSLWADYLSERLGKIVLEAEEGFAVYLYTMWNDRKAVYIEEIYVRPDLRKSGVAASLAKEQGCAFFNWFGGADGEGLDGFAQGSPIIRFRAIAPGRAK